MNRLLLSAGAVGACAIAAALPTAAAAAPARVGPDQRSVSAIALAGSDVLWTTRAASGGQGRLWRRGADGRVRSVRRVESFGPVVDDSSYNKGSEVVRLDAAGALARVGERNWNELGDKIEGSLAGPLGSVAALVDTASGRRTDVQRCRTIGDAALAGS